MREAVNNEGQLVSSFCAKNKAANGHIHLLHGQETGFKCQQRT